MLITSHVDYFKWVLIQKWFRTVLSPSVRPEHLDNGGFGLDYVARLTLAPDTVTALCQALSGSELTPELTSDQSVDDSRWSLTNNKPQKRSDHQQCDCSGL